LNHFIRRRANETVSAVGIGDASASEFNSDILNIREVDIGIVNNSVNNSEGMNNIEDFEAVTYKPA
jgi:hypothetical protein